MADSYNKKEREKKKRKRREEKAERKKRLKEEGAKTEEFMYLDENGNLTPIKPTEEKKIEIKLEDIQISTPKASELEKMEEEELSGTVKFFKEDKGYGFINHSSSKESYFFHANNTLDQVTDNDKVFFELDSGPKGLFAINVRLQSSSQ